MNPSVTEDPGIATSRCPECDAPACGTFCPACGARLIFAGDDSLRLLLGEWSGDWLGLDGRIVRTVKALLVRPGHLTAEYLRGRRRRYIRPFQLFLIVNVMFFVLAVRRGIYDFTLQEYLDFTPPSTELTRAWVAAALDATGRTFQEYEAAFNANADLLRKGLIIILVPFLALAAWALHFRRRPHVVPHLVFSVHVFAFYWLFVSLLGPPLWFVVEAVGLRADPALFLINMLVLTGYSFLALRYLNGQSVGLTALKAVGLTAAVVVLLRSYRILLFFGTWALT